MKSKIIERFKLYIIRKFQALVYGTQMERDENLSNNLTFQLKTIKLGEEIKYFRIPQE